MSAARFCLTAWDGRSVPCASPVPGGHALGTSGRGSWPRVIATHVGWPPLPLLRTLPRKPSPILLCPSHRSAMLLPTLLHAGCCFIRRCSSPTSRPELSDRAKKSASSPRPSCTKSMPAAPASEAGAWDFPVVIFLCEHLTDDSLH
jgi:hypothetical protein